MTDVKWIKLDTNIFDNRKIRQIEALPDGSAIIIMWLKILCLAGSINDGGQIYFTNEIPYTDQMLATQFGLPLATVQLGLKVFSQFGMIDVVDDVIMIANWNKYQNVEGLDKVREQTRKRVAEHRERQKALTCNVTCNATVTHGNALDKDIDIEKEYIYTLGQNDAANDIKMTVNDQIDDRNDQDGFDQFWQQYPRKVKKQDALRAWKKQKPPDSILEALAAWKGCEQWNRDGGQYIPYPATFLNARQWEETPEVIKVTKPRDDLITNGTIYDDIYR